MSGTPLVTEGGRRRVRLTVEYFTAARICRESSLKDVHQRKARLGAYWLQAVDISERSEVEAEAEAEQHPLLKMWSIRLA
ncbi:TPA: hypothetical protein JLE41_004428 [Escherichia coli]|nr:hypothetical protein [Escherichia coli]